MARLVLDRIRRRRTLSSARLCRVALFLMVLLFAAPALTIVSPGRGEAQGTGGSFGGGDWGSGSSGGSDYGSGSSGGYGGSYGGGGGWSTTPDYGSSGSYGGGYPVTYGGGGGGGLGCGGLCCLLFIGLIVVAAVLNQRRNQPSMPTYSGGTPMAMPGAPGMPGGMPGAMGPPMGTYTGYDAMYVSQIQLGLDWRARAQLQAQLKQMAASGMTGTPQGLQQLLSETVLALRRNEMSWLYASYVDRGGHPPQSAQQVFGQLAQEARSRFRSEVVRAAGGGPVQQQAAGAMTARADEGQGTVVVTVVVAARRPLAGFVVADAGQIRNALSDRGSLLPQQLVALEVIWSPAEENDRMSSAELEQVYPELKLIDPNSIAGRIFCAFCNGPFPAELLTCPHCGAPAEQSKNRRSPKG